ncbi:pyridoxal phosphate-dependent decarboxylase family protein [Dongia rigui]|uniref:Pyridoxal-dependent decarboxylase n=1 Tax=Dongia rigui TaxID=940149 RepID=A0ABU5DXG4_9PROT|nr:pyridoxal-dependent decarboxylase [Dongia rigui]MDY0871610.1 pyridoxal-dependent decarboxylase [Dongia rigui]
MNSGKTTPEPMRDVALGPLFQTAAAHALRYRSHVAEAPQRPSRDFMAMLATFAAPLPETGAEGPAIIDQLARDAEPGLHAMTGPRFFGWVIGASHPVGVAADWLTSAWGQNTGNHVATPAAAAVEAVAAGWLLDLLDLPRECSVGFVTGATVANFVGLAAARHEVLRRAGWDVEAQGLFGAPPISVMIGDDAHTTVFSALQFLGLGHDRVIRVATDAAGRMRADAFRDAIAPLSGPIIVICQAGQINTGAFDPFAEIIALARAKGAWVHVDGAFGLWARAEPELKGQTGGIEQADSWATDGHKWLQTPYDCGYAIVRHPEAHRRAMTIAASYLPPAQAGERDPSHYVPELSRRARGFATYAIIRHLGRQGIAAMVARHCRVARIIAARVVAEPGIAVLHEVTLNQMLLRFGGDGAGADDLTRRTIARLQADGICFAGGAAWRGSQVMRLSVISWYTTEAEAEIAADAIIAAWRAVKAGANFRDWER